MMKKGIAYLRVSTHEQHLSPEAQKHAIRAWGHHALVNIAETHQDEISGATDADKREGLMAALEAVKRHKADYLVVLRRDRLARDRFTAAWLDREVEKLGARIVSADGVANQDTPEDRLLRGILDSMAEYERALIRSRIKSALGVKKRRGEVVGELPFGYSRSGDKLVEEPGEQVVIRRIRQLRHQGHSVYRITDILASEGFVSRSGKPLHRTQVTRILRGR